MDEDFTKTLIYYYTKQKKDCMLISGIIIAFEFCLSVYRKCINVAFPFSSFSNFNRLLLLVQKTNSWCLIYISMVKAAKLQMSGGSGENKDPNLPTTFQRIHEMIGAPIMKEIEDYRKQNPNKYRVSSTGSMASPDGAPLIVL